MIAAGRSETGLTRLSRSVEQDLRAARVLGRCSVGLTIAAAGAAVLAVALTVHLARGGSTLVDVRTAVAATVAALAAAAKVRIIKRATSLGGVESLIEHRASIEGPASKTPDNLLRFSVGLENAADLIEDLDNALRV